jgi:excisionase family DNA binding protein
MQHKQLRHLLTAAAANDWAGIGRALINWRRFTILETTETSGSGGEPRVGRSVSLDDAAQLLGVSRRTIYNRIREGRLQTIRTLGGSQRVLLDSVQDVRAES